MGKKIVAITACPVGIAHTYMAATALEKIAKEKGHTIRIEKQGSMGPEDVLTHEEIAQADLVIIAVNKSVDLERFKGKLLYQTTADHAMKNSADVLALASIDARFHDVKGSVVGGITLGKTSSSGVMNHIMAGLGYMIPLTISAGMLMSISNVLSMQIDDLGNVTQRFSEASFIGHFLKHLGMIGPVGFMLMTPVFAGMVANSIGGMPAIAPAMMGAYIANNATYLGTQSGGGFFSAILVALMVGYLIKYLKMLPWPVFFKPILGIMILPIIGTLITMVVVTYGLGKPMALLMRAMHIGLEDLMVSHPNSGFSIGFVLGGMMGFDFGGPVNKTAFMFGGAIEADTIQKFGLLGANLVPATAAVVAAAISPFGVFISSILFSKYFTSEEKTAAKAAASMGIFGITEGVIPFAVARPLQTIVASVIGSGVGSGLSYTLHLERIASFTMFIGFFQGPSYHSILYIMCLLTGALVVALIIGFWRKFLDKSIV